MKKPIFLGPLLIAAIATIYAPLAMGTFQEDPTQWIPGEMSTGDLTVSFHVLFSVVDFLVVLLIPIAFGYYLVPDNILENHYTDLVLITLLGSAIGAVGTGVLLSTYSLLIVSTTTLSSFGLYTSMIVVESLVTTVASVTIGVFCGSALSAYRNS